MPTVLTPASRTTANACDNRDYQCQKNIVAVSGEPDGFSTLLDLRDLVVFGILPERDVGFRRCIVICCLGDDTVNAVRIDQECIKLINDLTHCLVSSLRGLLHALVDDRIKTHRDALHH